MSTNEFPEFGPLENGGGDDAEAMTSRERLLNRVVDGEATDAEWAEFRALANAEFGGADTSAWRDLAEAQRQQAVLSAAVGRHVRAAQQVELPRRHEGHWESPAVIGRVRSWTGWAAAAAVLTLVVLNGSLGDMLRLGTPGTGQPVNTAGLFRIDSAEDAIQIYKDKGMRTGRVIDEMPGRVLVESRPRTDGEGFEVVYIRQFIERAEVTDLYRFGQDERGGAVLVPVSAPARGAESF